MPLPQTRTSAAAGDAVRRATMQRLHVAGADYKTSMPPRRARRLCRGPTLMLALLLAAPFAAFATAPPPAHCATAGARDALAARALQTDLMVAALVCDRREDYNAFVRRHRATLAAHGGALRAWFVQEYGRGGETEMNRFVTRLANEASRASNGDRALYCHVTGSLFDGLAGADVHGLETVIGNPLLAVRHGVAACGAPASSAAAAELSARP